MMITLQKMARSTPLMRQEIAASTNSVATLAKHYNVTEMTIRKWLSRSEFNDCLEVLRAGSPSVWAAKDYQSIISIANNLPEETLREDEKLLTPYDLALPRTEES